MVKCPYPLYEIDLFDKKERLCNQYTDLHDYVKAFIWNEILTDKPTHNEFTWCGRLYCSVDKNKEILFVPQTLYHGTPLQITKRFCKDYHLDTKTVKIFYLENTNER